MKINQLPKRSGSQDSRLRIIQQYRTFLEREIKMIDDEVFYTQNNSTYIEFWHKVALKRLPEKQEFTQR